MEKPTRSQRLISPSHAPRPQSERSHVYHSYWSNSLTNHTVFNTSATADPSVGTTLCAVCRTARQWMLPVLYSNVVLSTPALAERFAVGLEEPGSEMNPDLRDSRERTAPSGLWPCPTSEVRHLWIGPTACPGAYAKSVWRRTTWPVRAIRAILMRCTDLRALAIVAVPHGVGVALFPFVPVSVEALFLGPAHPRVEWKRVPRLRSLTSASTFMLTSELEGIAQAPDATLVRRVFTSSTEAVISLEQMAACVRVERGSEVHVLVPLSREEDQGVLEKIAAECTIGSCKLEFLNAQEGIPLDVVALMYAEWIADVIS